MSARWDKATCFGEAAPGRPQGSFFGSNKFKGIVASVAGTGTLCNFRFPKHWVAVPLKRPLSPLLITPSYEMGSPSNPNSTARGPNLRDDVQALRAIAVLLVVIFHLFPERLTGGYVGVDSFLAISGYLITAHLVREVSATGSVNLKEFWARRMRRLLPAALFVLLATLVATLIFIPSLEWRRTARDVASAVFYLYNFVLVHDATDYFAEDRNPSSIQHFWSLSVEEQFYFIWPILIALVCKFSGAKRLAWIRIAALGTFAVSLSLSVTHTEAHPASAYFLLPTRMWEFTAGALVALFGLRWRSYVPSEAPRIAGFAGLIAAASLLSPDATFPGWIAAFPILATVLVLIPSSRTEAPRDWRLLRCLSPIGDLSYGIYLWHWPLLILCGDYLGRLLTTPELVAIGFCAPLLAYLTKRWIEDPLRFSRPLVAMPTRTFIAASAAMVLVASTAWALDARYELLFRNSSALTELVSRSDPPCLGARAIASDTCTNPALDGVLVPRPIEASEDIYKGCSQRSGRSGLVQCTLGENSSHLTIALVGDSHAGHLIPGIKLAAKEAGVRILTFVKAGCPFARAPRRGPLRRSNDCERWKKSVRGVLKKDKKIGAIITIGYAGRMVNLATEKHLDYDELLDDEASAHVKEWDALPKHIKRILVIRDTPRSDRTVLPCLERLDIEAQLMPGACALPVSFALPADPLVVAAGRRRKRTTVIDLSPVFCDGQTCKAVIGHVVVHRDTAHLTQTFSRTLAPTLAEHLRHFAKRLR